MQLLQEDEASARVNSRGCKTTTDTKDVGEDTLIAPETFAASEKPWGTNWESPVFPSDIPLCRLHLFVRKGL